ncbi:MAG: hypothetical protein AB7T06_24960, partial [Kofleriaceae bacterium]
TSLATVVVHKNKYVDASKDIDLSEDFKSEFILKKVEEPVVAVKKAPEKKQPEKKQPEKKQPEKKQQPVVEKKTPPVEKKPACQPPGQVDPFDSRPVCK